MCAAKEERPPIPTLGPPTEPQTVKRQFLSKIWKKIEMEAASTLRSLFLLVMLRSCQGRAIQIGGIVRGAGDVGGMNTARDFNLAVEEGTAVEMTMITGNAVAAIKSEHGTLNDLRQQRIMPQGMSHLTGRTQNDMQTQMRVLEHSQDSEAANDFKSSMIDLWNSEFPTVGEAVIDTLTTVVAAAEAFGTIFLEFLKRTAVR